MVKKVKAPKLPDLIKNKIYKTGQTRGADNSQIYQNRVGRNSTVLIPFNYWDELRVPPNNATSFESGYICLISPEDYFGSTNIDEILQDKGLVLGENLLVYYSLRDEWINYPPKLDWEPGSARSKPLNGQYIARISGTTSDEGDPIIEGYNTSRMKGAGIRIYEYASTEIINACRIQLESLFWLCEDSIETVIEYGMSPTEAHRRRDMNLLESAQEGLLDFDKLKASRMVNEQHFTICPLCLGRLSAKGFFSRMAQARGREVHDLTITEINLFHIKELRHGEYNHRPYNLGWGHHHCNVVVKDAGIDETLTWMKSVIDENISAGFEF